MSNQKANEYLDDYNERLEAAEAMLPIVGKLWRNQGIPTYLYGVPLHLKGPIEILKSVPECTASGTQRAQRRGHLASRRGRR